MSHPILTTQEMFVEKLRYFEEKVTTRAPETLEEDIYVNCMNFITVEYQQADCVVKFSNTCQSYFSYIFFFLNVKTVQKGVYLYIFLDNR